MSDMRELMARIEQHEKVLRDLVARTANMSVRSGAGGGGNDTEFAVFAPPAITSGGGVVGIQPIAARSDHTHHGIEHVTATNKASLTTEVTDGSAWGATTSPRRIYVRNDSEWVCITHLEVP